MPIEQENVFADGKKTEKTEKARSIDAHAHWAPEGYVRLMAQLGHPAATGPLNPLMSDLEKRVKWMDERGVQMHVLTLSGSMPWQWARTMRRIASRASSTMPPLRRTKPTPIVSSPESRCPCATPRRR